MTQNTILPGGRPSIASKLDLPRVELTVLIPCLNESKTLGLCIERARQCLQEEHISGEILVADNGSTDDSVLIAESLGARVVRVQRRGYGAALIGGIAAAQGQFIVMADGDDSYDFGDLQPFLRELRNGADLVIGNRFKAGIDSGAMPFLHRYLGNPVLSCIGQLFFRVNCGDFHCGMRGLSRSAYISLNLKSEGMEFASEMIIRAAIEGLKISEVPTTLRKDGRDRPPHLNTWKDGWRHLRLLLMYSPRWLFLYPGIGMIFVGMVAALLLMPGPIQITKSISLDVHTFLVACMSIVLGVQSITFGLLARRQASANGLLRPSRYQRILNWLTLENMLWISFAVILCGTAGMVWSLFKWSSVGFGPLDYESMVRVVTFSLTMIVVGFQFGLTAFLISVIDLDRISTPTKPRPPDGIV